MKTILNFLKNLSQNIETKVNYNMVLLVLWALFLFVDILSMKNPGYLALKLTSLLADIYLLVSTSIRIRKILYTE